jgi:hypothetical protein
MLGAIANAIYDATGLRVKELPTVPHRILEFLEAKAANDARKEESSGGQGEEKVPCP